jgi:hypothetical protein
MIALGWVDYGYNMVTRTTDSPPSMSRALEEAAVSTRGLARDFGYQPVTSLKYRTGDGLPHQTRRRLWQGYHDAAVTSCTSLQTRQRERRDRSVKGGDDE